MREIYVRKPEPTPEQMKEKARASKTSRGMFGSVFNLLGGFKWGPIGKVLKWVAIVGLPILAVITVFTKGKSILKMFSGVPGKIVGAGKEFLEGAWDSLKMSLKYGAYVNPEEAKAIQAAEKKEEEGAKLAAKTEAKNKNFYENGAFLTGAFVDMLEKGQNVIPKKVVMNSKGDYMFSTYIDGQMYHGKVSDPTILQELFLTEKNNTSIAAQIAAYVVNTARNWKNWNPKSRLGYMNTLMKVLIPGKQGSQTAYYASRFAKNRVALDALKKKYPSMVIADGELFDYEPSDNDLDYDLFEIDDRKV